MLPIVMLYWDYSRLAVLSLFTFITLQNYQSEVHSKYMVWCLIQMAPGRRTWGRSRFQLLHSHSQQTPKEHLRGVNLLAVGWQWCRSSCCRLSSEAGMAVLLLCVCWHSAIAMIPLLCLGVHSAPLCLCILQIPRGFQKSRPATVTSLSAVTGHSQTLNLCHKDVPHGNTVKAASLQILCALSPADSF